jgi:hypothetical protein
VHEDRGKKRAYDKNRKFLVDPVACPGKTITFARVKSVERFG